MSIADTSLLQEGELLARMAVSTADTILDKSSGELQCTYVLADFTCIRSFQ